MSDGGIGIAAGIRRAATWAVAAFLVVAFLGAVAAVLGQRLVVYPGGYLHDRDTPFLPIGWKEIRTGTPGRDLRAYEHPGSGSSPPVLIVMHGNAADPFSMASTAAPWTRAGWRVVVPEYPGYADAPGSPDEAGIIASAEASWNHVVRSGTPPRRIVVLGNSIGAGPAIALAGSVDPAMLMIVSGPATMRGLMQEKVPPLPSFLVKDAWENDERIRKVESPVRIWHGRKDTLIPYDHGVRLARTAGTIVSGRDAGHELFWSNRLQEEMLRIADRTVGGTRR